MTTVGNGEYTYEPVENWAKLPPCWSFKEIRGVGVDRRDNVYTFNRGEHPMIVFDREGNFLRSFGEGGFPRAHGVFMAPDDTVWLTEAYPIAAPLKEFRRISPSAVPRNSISHTSIGRARRTSLSAPQGRGWANAGFGPRSFSTVSRRGSSRVNESPRRGLP